MLRAIILSLIFVLIGINSFSQFYKRKLNSYDKNGKRTGLWLLYWDDDEKIPMSRGFYKNGYETRVSKEYHQSGKIRLKLRYYKDSRLKVKFYSEYRVLEAKGGAILEYNKEDTHFYYQGKWKYYNPKRKLIKIGRYENGDEIVSPLTDRAFDKK